jgi:hypothetical protein
MALVIPISILSGDQQMQTINYIRWLAHSVALATLPAGIVVGDAVLESPRRSLITITIIVALSAFFVFALLGVVGPAVTPEADPDFFRLLTVLRSTGTDWLTHNHNAWIFSMTTAETISTILFAALGIQLGIWAPRVLSATVRRILYWVVVLVLLFAGYVTTDTLYENVVIRTAGPVDFAGFLGLLLPAGLCFGLLLPTVALLRDYNRVDAAR